jgi:competence protein ComEA
MAEYDPGQPSLWDRYRVPIILILVSIVSLGISLILFIESHKPDRPIEFVSADQIASGSAQIMIDIGGGVVNPGVYHLSHGARVQDAIALAGGLSADADEALIAKAVNRARVLVDGEKIYFPEKGAVKSAVITVQNSSAQQENSLVSVNTASMSELDTLPGIGEVTARKIIDGRPYVALEDLVIRKVLSQSVYEKIREQISL